MSILLYGSETIIWREKERSMIRAVQMDILRKMKGLTKVFFDGSAILIEWEIIGLL